MLIYTSVGDFVKPSLGRSCVSVGSFIQDQYLGII
jgi:hypothetical protein